MAETTQDIAGYASLGSDINKNRADGSQDNAQGIVSEKLLELTLEMGDDEIIKLTEKWEKKWKESPVKSTFEKKGEENEKYWLGTHFDLPEVSAEVAERPNVDNLIFESVETYLPQITRRNPEPMVALHSSELDDQGNADPAKLKYVQKVKNRLADLADENVVRLKLKGAGRHWALFLLGTLKVGWDLDKDIPTVRVVRAKKLILDPESTVTEDGYSGDYVGEYRKLKAQRIIDIVGSDEKNAKAIVEIKKLVKNDLGTEVQFIEWWAKEYLCWTLGKNVLLKKKNPHWNYDQVGQQSEVDAYGTETATSHEVKGNNHFTSPQIPFIFLSIYNLDEQPVDKTSLIGQNLANQDRINRRSKQIDKNVDNMNGGMVVSLARSGLTQPQAKNVTASLQRGGTVVIPDGIPREAIDRYPAPALPPDIYQDLLDSRSRLRDIFGTRGSTPAGIESEETVRGKIMNRNLDTDRIGGGISEYLEQIADKTYNWFVQMLYVYDTGFQFVGGAKPPKITISVKEGSLLPKDSTTIANQAIDLGKSGKMALKDMYERLEYPNPEQLAANVWLEVNAPHLLYQNNPLVQQAIMAQQQAAAAQADAEASKGAEEHGRAMETEVVKGVMKNQAAKGPARPRSNLLSQVPANAVAPQT